MIWVYGIWFVVVLFIGISIDVVKMQSVSALCGRHPNLARASPMASCAPLKFVVASLKEQSWLPF